MHAPRKFTAGIALLSALAAALAAGGCRGERSDNPPRQFFPDMDDQEKWKPQSQSQFFADGRTMRPRVDGTVAFGRSIDPAAPERTGLLKDDAGFYLGVDGNGQKLDYMPMAAIDAFREAGEDTGAAMARMIARGKARYNITCAACHSYTGDGQGSVGARWSYPLPTYFDAKYTDRNEPTGKDGHLFDVIRNGVIDTTGAVKMPPYNHAIDERDAWAIVAYVRTLQASHTTDLDRLPAAKRQELERARRLPPPPIPPGPRAVEPPESVPAPTDPVRQDPPMPQEPTPAGTPDPTDPATPPAAPPTSPGPEEGRS